MDFEGMGAGAGAGILATVLTAMGFKSRLDKIDKVLEEKIVYKDVCSICQKSSETHFNSLNEKMDILIKQTNRHREG